MRKKTGIKEYGGRILEIVDLPGTYSLTAYSADEVVARDYILEEKPDVVIQVLDSTNLERNLYLTTQLLEIGTNLILALNMSDLAERKGEDVNIPVLEKLLGISLIRTTANEGKGINELLDEIILRSGSASSFPNKIEYNKKIEDEIRQLERILAEDEALMTRYLPGG